MNLKYKLKIYDKYILQQVFYSTFAAILLFTIVWIAPEMLLNTIKYTLEGEYTVKEAIFIIVLELPKILGKAFPVGLLLGTLFTFDKLSKDSELTILRAIGLSFNRIIAPVVVFSLLITGLCFITYDKLIPYSEVKKFEIQNYKPVIQYMYNQKDENKQPKLSVVVSSFYDGIMAHIIVLDFSRKIYDDLHGLSKIYAAKGGRTFPDHWELYNVTTYKISQDGIYVDISNEDKVDILQGEDAMTAYTLMTNSVKKEREITNTELLKYVKLLKRESLGEEYSYMLNKYYQRFFHPFVCVLLAIMGCLLGFSKPREQRLIGFTVAIATIFAYYITLPFFDLLAEKEILNPFLTAIMPLIAFYAAVVAIYKHKDL
ncbi:MAG: LptF/LptG family permease [Candidatus Gastranaerophilaceae bacterium]